MAAESADIFLGNMSALWARDSRLAFAVDQLAVDAQLPLEPTRCDLPTCSITTPDGHKVYLHSRHRPDEEAEQLCRTLDSAEEEAPLAVVLCGMGLGYHIKPLRRRVGPEGLIYVLEPDLLTIKTALSVTDLSDEIRDGRLFIIHNTDKSETQSRLEPYSSLLMMGTRIVMSAAYRRLHEEFFRTVRGYITDHASFARMSLVTLVSNARITCGNIADNLAAMMATPSIESLRRRFRGYPGVVVAAGPSLGRNVDQLAAYKDRVVMVAVQTTLKPMLSRGIRPHFVTSLDYSDLSRHFFEGTDPSGVHLVAEPKASCQVIDTFLGGAPGEELQPNRRLSLLYNDFAQRCLGEELGQRAGLRAGATVAHLAFYLCEFLGCDPIILIGQDLGFSGGVYYTPGVAIHDVWRNELGSFGTLEMKEWERIMRARNILHRTKDVHDRPIFTDDQMFTYLQQFERDFAATGAKVIDATEGGVRKQYTTPMTLQDALSQFANRPIPPESHLSEEAYGGTVEADRISAASDALHQRLEELAEFRGLCEETNRLLEQMVPLVDRPQEFDRRIVRVDELRAMVAERSTIFRMVTDVSQKAELQKFQADRLLHRDRVRAAEGDTMTPAQRAVRQLGRDRSFVEALLEGCNEMERILRRASERMDAMRQAVISR